MILITLLCAMFEHTNAPHTGEICDALREIIGAKRSPLLGIITDVEPVDDGYPPTFSLPVSGVAAANREMTGGRLAKTLSEELNRTHWSSPSCIASLSIHTSDDIDTDKVSNASHGVDVDRLREYLGQRIAQTGLRPYALNLITVTFGKQWAYLSLICPRIRLDGFTSREREATYRQLRHDLLVHFGVRLRLVLTAPSAPKRPSTLPPVGLCAGRLSDNTVATSWCAQPRDKSIESHVGETPSVVFRGLPDWTNLYLCSVDSRGARRLEDIVGEGSETCKQSRNFDLRICHPLALHELRSLSPEAGTLPAIGVQALVGSTGELMRGAVRVVAASNSCALDVYTASSMLRAEEDAATGGTAGEVLRRLYSIAGRIRSAQSVASGVTVLNLGRARDTEGEPCVLPRAEVLIESLMRLSQSCILNWRNSLVDPPSLLVSRPVIEQDDRSERLMSVLNCELQDLIDQSKMKAHSAILCERGGERLLEVFAQVVHDAYCRRKLQVVAPHAPCLAGDVLPIKRGRFGQLNNVQVALAALGEDPLAFEVVQSAWRITNKNETATGIAAQQTFACIRQKQERIWQVLAAKAQGVG